MKVWKLSPSKCVFCNYYATYEELPICFHCANILQTLLTERCENCGNTPNGCDCGENRNVRFLFFFENMFSRSLTYFIKTNADDRIVDFVAELMVVASGIDPKSFDAVTYVPRLRRNIRRYGYDQAKELAKAISKIFGITLVTSLERIGGGDQKLLSRAQRLKNIIGKYRLKFVPDEKYKKILLVDDICTTGATIEACATILRGGFAASVVPLVIAKTKYKKR